MFGGAMLRFLAVLAVAVAGGTRADDTRTRNVILVMSDGLRWQEVFRGADETLISKEAGLIDMPEPVREKYWRPTPEQRRETLMPFLWTVVAREGQIYGNRDAGSDAHVTNDKYFSYPGYNETFCGFADATITSNSKVPNANVTVFEWLHAQEGFSGKVAAFGAWDVFPFIFNADRCGFPVDGGNVPFEPDPSLGRVTPRIALLNRLRVETPARWSGAHFDSLVFHTALEWMKENKPRVMFVGLGETDEWGHEGRYADYLDAARRADSYMRELWETAQSMPDYNGTTSMIVTCDHGRGDNSIGPRDWNNHGAKHPGSDEIWIAIIGPDTPTLGERNNIAPVTQAQVAATIAALLDKDYVASQPRAGAPIADAIRAAAPAR
jgi:hypothetical protein